MTRAGRQLTYFALACAAAVLPPAMVRAEIPPNVEAMIREAGRIGNSRTVAAVTEVAKSLNPDQAEEIGKLGEGRNVEQLLPLLQRPEKELKVEAMHALAAISDEKRAEHVRLQLQAQAQGSDQSVAVAAQSELMVCHLGNDTNASNPPAV